MFFLAKIEAKSDWFIIRLKWMFHKHKKNSTLECAVENRIEEKKEWWNLKAKLNCKMENEFKILFEVSIG